MRRLRRLSVRQFRSYPALNLPLDGRSVALTGPNGAGKTNLLEALSMIAPGRGLRRATLAEILQQGANPDEGWGVAVDLQSEDEIDPVTLAVMATPPHPFKKTVRIDGEPVTPGASSEYVRFTWLTPAQDRLFLDGPSGRRRFIDRMTLSYDAAHGQAAAGYEKAMRQRQAVLAAPRPDPSLLSVLERQMAEAGVAVAAGRKETVARLGAGYEALRTGMFPTARVSLQGMLEERLAQCPAAEAEDLFQDELAQSRPADMAAGRALVGPHRSDLVVQHAAKDQPARNCSTGEQKALLIGLVLAHAAVVSAQGDGVLILLLDEIAAHLDEGRRRALADILEGLGCQAVMTGTDRQLFDAWGNRAQRFHVADGRVEAISDGAV